MRLSQKTKNHRKVAKTQTCLTVGREYNSNDLIFASWRLGG